MLYKPEQNFENLNRMKHKNLQLITRMLVVTLLAAFVLTACKNVSKKVDQSIPGEEVEVKDQIQQEVTDFVYPLPRAYEVTEMINRIGIPYSLGTSNTVENASNYFTAKSKAFNIGVYGTDLSYASTYRMTQETMLYLEAINQLGNDLGISSIYNEDLLTSIEENINNKDTLVEIITTTVYDTYDFLNKNGKGDLAILMVAGGWIEAMYLTNNVILNTYGNAELMEAIYAQKASFIKLMEVIDNNKSETNVQELMESIQPVKEAFDAITSKDMTEEQFNALDKAVEDLRNQIVS